MGPAVGVTKYLRRKTDPFGAVIATHATYKEGERAYSLFKQVKHLGCTTTNTGHLRCAVLGYE